MAEKGFTPSNEAVCEVNGRAPRGRSNITQPRRKVRRQAVVVVEICSQKVSTRALHDFPDVVDKILPRDFSTEAHSKYPVEVVAADPVHKPAGTFGVKIDDPIKAAVDLIPHGGETKLLKEREPFLQPAVRGTNEALVAGRRDIKPSQENVVH